MQASIRGGTSETEQTAVAVNPRGSPCRSRVVTTVTPVARMPMALRNPFASRVIGALSAGSYAQSLVCQPVAKKIYVLARNRKCPRGGRPRNLAVGTIILLQHDTENPPLGEAKGRL